MFQRYAIFYTAAGAFAARGAAWLGWDSASGTALEHMDAELEKATERPRKYGFHGTIKAPFRLHAGQSEDALLDAFKTHCQTSAPNPRITLELAQIGRFLAFVPKTDGPSLNTLAQNTVQALDHFRAPLTEAEIERRRPGRLSERQKANLHRWGYPFVMDDFKFHMTLTGNLKPDQIAQMQERAHKHFDKAVPEPLNIDTLSLMGEDKNGMFHVISRQPLNGNP